MEFIKTSINGAYLIKRNAIQDKRGYFGRLYCAREFKENGIEEDFVQDNICLNEKNNTLRGLHFQTIIEEGKLVSCLKGKIWDVCVDLRSDSSSFCQYYAHELSEENQYMLYIPKGCAHGYVTLESNSLLLYKMTEFYIPGNDKGYRYNDPSFGIEWPVNLDNLIISDKDRNLPFFGK